MADQEQLVIIRQGPEAWNRWRIENPTLKPDLSGADLIDADLSGVDLSGADLSGVRLINASLSWANLGEATLFKAVLHGAALNRADLSKANLFEADLRGTNLRGTYLMKADLTGTGLADATLIQADLTGANITRAQLFFTVFGHTTLMNVLGLDACIHNGPSILDHATLAQSGQLPLSFLRGCGLPDTLITFLPSLQNEAFQYDSCFISHSTEDQEFAARLHADLQSKGVRCWFAQHDVQGGKYLYEQIDKAIQLHDRLLLVLSESSIQSEWVKTEISKARRREIREKRRMLFPVRLMAYETLRQWECFDADIGKDSAREIREYYVPDFSNWKNHDLYQVEFEKLLRDLKPEAAPQYRQ
jgi:hypothetical protein